MRRSSHSWTVITQTLVTLARPCCLVSIGRRGDRFLHSIRRARSDLSGLVLGRLRHHRHSVEIGNGSHRLLHSSAVAKKRIKAREQARQADKQPPPEANI